MWDGKYVAGFSKVSALKRSTDVIIHREGGSPILKGGKSPGRIQYEAITLERGITHDPEFKKWTAKEWNYGNELETESSLQDFRKDIIIDLYNEAGQIAMSYKIYRCWVSEYQAMPDLDANSNAMAIEKIKLENEGWERNEAIT